MLGACGEQGREKEVYIPPLRTDIESAVTMPQEEEETDPAGGILEKSAAVEDSQDLSDKQGNFEETDQPLEQEDTQASRPVEETIAESEVSYWRIDGGDANIRKAPDYHSESIQIGKEGRDLEYLHKKVEDPRDSRIWYNVQNDAGEIGWISSAVVVRSDGRYFAAEPISDDEANSAAEASVSTVRYYATREANIRQSPSIDAPTIGQAAGDSVLEGLNGQSYDPSDGRTWYYVRTPSGLDGWISSKMVTGYAPSAESAYVQEETGGVYYENCAAAEAAGAAPVYEGEAGYAGWLDRDSDGIGCEISDWDSYDGGSSDSSDPPISSDGNTVYFKNCTVARAAGAAPVYAGDLGYSRKLDRDGDGVGCE